MQKGDKVKFAIGVYGYKNPHKRELKWLGTDHDDFSHDTYVIDYARVKYRRPFQRDEGGEYIEFEAHNVNNPSQIVLFPENMKGVMVINDELPTDT